jgi:hypothetical protein
MGRRRRRSCVCTGASLEAANDAVVGATRPELDVDREA